MLKKVYLEITDDCNLGCEICYRHQWIEKPRHMAIEIWENVVEQLKQSDSVETVVLGGMGEPLFSPRFIDTVEKLKNKQIWVTSNGTMLKDVVTTDVAKNIAAFVISVDGMESQMIHSRGVVLTDLLGNIDHLNQIKTSLNTQTPHIDVQFVASRKNIHDIFPLMDVLSTRKIRNLIISHLLPQDEKQAEDILYTRYENQAGKELFHKIRNYSFRRGLRIVFPEMELKTERRCAFISNDATYITASGMVVPCYRLSHQGKEVVFGRTKTIRQYSFGNLAKDKLTDIWNSRPYSQFRHRIFNNHFPSCPDCDLVEGCSLIDDVDFDCNGDEPNCSDCLWARKFVFCN